MIRPPGLTYSGESGRLYWSSLSPSISHGRRNLEYACVAHTKKRIQYEIPSLEHALQHEISRALVYPF